MTVQPFRDRYDVVIVGARCAGAATAMLLGRRGLRVLAVDRELAGSDTLSTHALMRGGVVQLSRWGVLPSIAAAGTPPVRRATFHYGEETISIAIGPRDGVDALYAPRRTVLDSALVNAARESGVDVRHRVGFRDLVWGSGGRVRGIIAENGEGGAVPIAADCVVGADGAWSLVARLVRAAPYHVGAHAAGVVYGYWSGLDPSGYEWYYGAGTSLGVIPTNGDLTCVFAATPAARFRSEIRADLALGYERVIAECAPDLSVRLGRARRVGHLRSFPGLPGFVRQSWGPGWALVGDAACFRDPLTAHGITDALRDAELLADAIATGVDASLAGYQETRDRLALALFDISDQVASFEWDFASLRRLHRTMSDWLSRESATLAALGASVTAVG